jgi:hypothetical protein
MLLLDFRDAPEELARSLEWILPPASPRPGIALSLG